MTTLTLEVPASLERDKEDTVRFLAAKLYESGKLTLGQAAQMAGMKKWDFAEILSNYGVNYIQYTFDDVIADVERIANH
ncbi:MAG TPA: UPF0175 family protein [Parapedobacter sp.]|uniref:UPF0175 family protein n=1 Tax=Parapedobacter sp. TaxID=1958893 RepID=UPI002CA915C7|nr:UPF0175 family protein [Parapedobacter sp.]HWK57574.1 UPF0175 family protein [Parapedobacter sp.]